jgi:hypothetical protein
MKLKITAAIIILSTIGLVGVIDLLLNKTADLSDNNSANLQGNKVGDKNREEGAVVADDDQDTPPPDDSDEDDILSEDSMREKPKLSSTTLSNDDVIKINNVAKLSDAELAAEIETLKKRIEEDEIFDELDEGNLSKEEEVKAKETLERFALLGLEKNRRKFMVVEPELKDALYAHRESLKEIREVLNEE